MKQMLNDKRTGEILNSFDGIRPAETPSFFYTRLKARMEREQESTVTPVFFLRPAFLAMSLSLVLIINIVFLTGAGKGAVPSAKNQHNTTGIQSFADAYDLNTSTVYE